MIKIKDLQRIHSSYKFIKWVAPECKMRLSKHDYAVNIEKEVIYVPLTLRDVDDLLFYDFLFKEYDKFVPNSMVISILHEIGHIRTDNREDNITSFALMDTYSSKCNNGEMTDLDYALSYFRTPREKRATDWAVDFYKKNDLSKLF